MPLNDVIFNRQSGGLDRPLDGEDHISGMVFYTAGSLPSGFSSSDRIKKIFSLADAEKLGILDDNSDETKGTGGKVVIGGTWVAGEVVSIVIDGATLGSFTVVSGSVTVADVVTGLTAAVNAGTSSGIRHGWTATESGGTDVELAQPTGLGIANNGSGISGTTDSAAGTITPTQFSGGVGSYFSVMHYHISEYFRIQPNGVLYVGIYPQGTFDATEIALVQEFSKNTLRQIAIYLSHESFASSQLTTIQGELDLLAADHKPLIAVLHSDMTSSTLATLPDLTSLSNEKSAMLIGEEGDYHQLAYDNGKMYLPGEKVTFQGKSYISKSDTEGNSPWDGTKWTALRDNLNAVSGFTIGTTGVTLGAISLASVEENIGWVAKFNLVTGTGLDEAAFATGDLWSNVTKSLKDTLDGYHYIFLRKHEGITGTYFNDSKTAISEADDYSTIENNRTADKAERNIRTNMLPNLNAPVFVDSSNGQLSEATMAQFKNDASRALVQMETDGEISGFEVLLDPTQNVLSTSKIVMGVKIVPVGVAREIEINLGFALSVG